MTKIRLLRITIPGATRFNAAWDALCSRIEYAANLQPAGIIRINEGSTGLVIRAELPKKMTVKLTASGGSGAYTASQVMEATGGGWTAFPTNPFSGTVYEWNGNASLPVTGSFTAEVEWFPFVQEWRFQAGSC